MKTTLFTLLLLIPILATGQEEKSTIAILPPTPYGSYSGAIWDAVTEAFVKTKRFEVIDRTTLGAIEKEAKLQSENDAIEMVASFEKGKGVEYFVSTSIGSITAEAMYTTDAQTKQKVFNGYKAKISILVKVVDISTTQTIASENIILKEGNLLKSMYKQHETAESAITDGITKVAKQIDEFVGTNFPATFLVVKVIEEKGGKATVVLISGGNDFGLQKGDKLKVVEYTTEELGGKKVKRTKEIGELKLNKVEDANFSQCKVSRGGDLILSKLSSGGELTVITLK